MTPRKSLQQIGLECGTDKSTAHSYLPIYEEAFDHLRDSPISLCEVGILEGASMKMWLEYFTLAHIYGIEASNFTKFADKRLTTYCCNAASEAVGKLFHPVSLDIIVDDGSHEISQVWDTYRYLMPALKVGGLYLIEDLQDCKNLDKWANAPGFKVWANFRGMNGHYRNDDVLVMVRKGG